jgi:lipopolysaccharide export system protein LptC
MKAFRYRKRQLIFPAILATALLLGSAWFWLKPETPKGGAASAPTAYRMQIEGLKFYGMNQGLRVISIAADRFTLRKGKIGFFSTGLTRTALIENAVIEIYAGSPASRNSVPADGSTTAHPGGDSATQGPPGKSPTESIDFSGLFSEETFASLMPVRSIAKVEIAPVTVRLHNDRSVLTEVTAAKASLLLKEREILFTGNVRVFASGAELTTDRLSFLPETGRLQTDRPFVLKQGRRTLEGTGLATDIFLK